MWLCDGNQSYDLKQFFNTLSQHLPKENKQFKRFYLSNTAIKVLEENTFSDIVFDEITIINATNLTLIHKNAFNGTNSHLNSLGSTGTPLINSIPEYDLFYALSTLTNATTIGLYRTNITEIPDNAFRPIIGYQNKLKNLQLVGNIQKLGNDAFYNLNSLESLQIYGNSIKSISPNAFNFKEESNKQFYLYVDYFLLSVFNSDIVTFANLKRPTTIAVVCQKSPCLNTYLDEKVFTRFLDSNEKNHVSSYGADYEQLDCNDCRSSWIISKNYSQRFADFRCNDGKFLTSSKTLRNCKHS